jgi:hypothetical protein
LVHFSTSPSPFRSNTNTLSSLLYIRISVSYVFFLGLNYFLAISCILHGW